MPDLGTYAFAVLASYGAALSLIVTMIGLSLRRHQRVKKELEALEKDRPQRG